MTKTSKLSINPPTMSKERTKSSGNLRSPPASPPYHSPNSPRSPGRESKVNAASSGLTYDASHSPITALPQPVPQSPRQEKTRSIFSSSKFSRSQSRLVNESPISQSPEAVPSMASVYQHPRAPGSTPDFRSPNGGESAATSGPSSPRLPSGRNLSSRDTAKSHSEPQLPFGSAPFNTDVKGGKRDKVNKHTFGQMLSRSRSIHREQSPMSRQPITDDATANPLPTDTNNLRTAPLEMKAQDKSFREMMRSSKRNRSADRVPPPKHLGLSTTEGKRAPSKERKAPGTEKEKEQGHFFQNIRNSKSKASELGKAGRGLFGKLTRSGSSHDREVAPEMPVEDITKYQPSIIRWDIVKQTRMTRISKRLEQSRDKTEFWLPSLPWRCIDYLNLKGTEVEGLYRVSGSVRELKSWQKRFDDQLDVDLLAQENLYDVNVVASLLKDWLRNIPDEIFPKETQAEIQRQCPEAANLESCPPFMQDELSKLPPFNYYLLFAITCHLSLLTACYERTKMDFENLCVCIQPSLNLDRFIFKILIKDWRNCWQGCWTERDYLIRENEYLAQQDPSHQDPMQSSVTSSRSDADSVSAAQPRSRTGNDAASLTNESRTLSSAGSHNPSMTEASTPEDRPARADRNTKDTIRPVLPSQEKDDDTTPRHSRARSPSPASSRDGSHDGEQEVSTDPPALTPFKPLSPLNLT